MVSIVECKSSVICPYCEAIYEGKITFLHITLLRELKERDSLILECKECQKDFQLKNFIETWTPYTTLPFEKT